LHEGTLRWEIGDPDLKIEQNINSEFSVNYSGSNFSVSAAGFYNHFSNYIFLNPSGMSTWVLMFLNMNRPPHTYMEVKRDLEFTRKQQNG
jgi:outer membrane receptor protein involved in Fe transport